MALGPGVGAIQAMKVDLGATVGAIQAMKVDLGAEVGAIQAMKVDLGAVVAQTVEVAQAVVRLKNRQNMTTMIIMIIMKRIGMIMTKKRRKD